jgi:hypothetical protein
MILGKAITRRTMSTPKIKNENSVTPLGLAVAILILSLLATVAIPRLKAVSEERTRPEAPRILSAYESSNPSAVNFVGCVYGGYGVGVVPAVSTVP